MAHQRKLGRPTDQRRAMLRSMTTSFLEKGRIETTVTRAKEVRKLAEKMVRWVKPIPFIQRDRRSATSPREM